MSDRKDIHLVIPIEAVEGSDRRVATGQVELMALANRTLIARAHARGEEIERCARDFDELAAIIEVSVGVASAAEVRAMAARARAALALTPPEPIPQLKETP